MMEEPGPSSENTVKLRPNSSLELTRSELLTLLGNMEAELQARDVVVALLKCERVKQLLVQAKYGQLNWSSPTAALQRDTFAVVGGMNDPSIAANPIIEESQGALDRLVAQQKAELKRMVLLLREAESRHEGDLESERTVRLRVEEELKLLRETMEMEKERQKQIILLLLAERKKIIGKFVEERKRTEDLAQILAEEKARMDVMAEGLEEETRKTLRLESEIEKQQQQMDSERQHFKIQLVKEERRARELETSVERLQAELESMRQHLNHSGNYLQQTGTMLPRTSPPLNTLQKQPPITPPRVIQPNPLMTSRSGSNLARGGSPSVDELPVPPPAVLVGSSRQGQPIATVNSIPVVQPTTGIARPVSPNIIGATGTIRPLPLANIGGGDHHRNLPTSKYFNSTESTQALLAGIEQTLAQVSPDRSTARPFPQATPSTQSAPATSRVAVQASPGSKVYTTSQGGKVTFHVTTSVATPSLATINANHSTSTAVAGKKPIPIGRGVPPPVPPNKPSIPPKKDSRTLMSPSKGDSAPLHVRPGQPQTLEPGQPISVAVLPQTKGGAQNVKLGITIGKDKIQVSSGPQQKVSVASDPSPDLESLSKELEDFQQLLFSMAATGPSDLISEESLST